MGEQKQTENKQGALARIAPIDGEGDAQQEGIGVPFFLEP